MRKYIIGIIALLALIPTSIFAYTVTTGDTLSSIGAKVGTSWRGIWSLNPQIKDPNIIRVGEILNTESFLGGNPLPTDNYDEHLTSPLSASAVTIYVSAIPTGVSDSIYTLFGSDGITPREKVHCTTTASTPARLTGCVRGISFSPSTGVIDETAGTGLSHSKNTRIAITDNINFSGKTLAVLNGAQSTGADSFFVGTATSTALWLNEAGKKICFGDTNFCIRSNGSDLQWSENAFTDTYNFTSSTITTLTASSTKGIGVTDSKIHINASTTLGLAFDDNGYIYQKTSSTLGILNDSNGIYLDESQDLTWTGTHTFAATTTLATTTVTGNLIGDAVLNTFTAGETIDASASAIPVYLHTDGLVYKTSATYATSTFTFIGFAVNGQNKSASQTILVQTTGVVQNMSGMATGSYYFLANTAGTLSTTAGTVTYQIGKALTPTTLLIEKGKKIINQSVAYTTAAATYQSTTTISLGFHPTKLVFTGGFIVNDAVLDSVASASWVNGVTSGWTITKPSAYAFDANSTYLITYTNVQYSRIYVYAHDDVSITIVKESTRGSGNSGLRGYVTIE